MNMSREASDMTATTATAPFANVTESVRYTTAATITSLASNGTSVQPLPCTATVPSWQLGLAAGLPSVVALVLAVILAVICLRQRAGCCCNKANQRREEPEEYSYEQTLPELSKGHCVSMGKGPPSLYENECRKPPRQLPAPVPRRPPGAWNTKHNAPLAGRQPAKPTAEALYETCVPSPAPKKRANHVGWD